MSTSGEAPTWLHFLRVGYPSANLVVTDQGERVLFDAGYGSDTSRTIDALASIGVPADSLDLIVNTHWHSDHVGGNARLQSEYAIPIAAALGDGEAVNSCEPGACLSEWLDQPVERYRVDRALQPGDRLTAGPVEWHVLATPGHTPHHLSFYQPEDGLLLLGDALHADDVGWLNLALDGLEAIDAALRTVESLSQLWVRLASPATVPPSATHRRPSRRRALATNECEPIPSVPAGTPASESSRSPS